MKFDDDALDRALFALPLEEPPIDLRASILNATIYRPAPVFKPWEVMTLGAIAAVVVWFVVLIALGGNTLFVYTAQAIATVLARGSANFLNLTTLAWVAVGGSTAIWLSIFTGFQPASEGVTRKHR
jgi:hypothetical protein